MKYLVLRRPDRGTAALAVRDLDDVGRLAAMLDRIALPGWHSATEWCVVEVDGPRAVGWPEPEPWASAG